jgi:uncharacterized protein YcfL
MSFIKMPKFWTLPLLAALLLTLGACGRPAVEYTDNKDVTIEDAKSRKAGDYLEVSGVLRNGDTDDVNRSVYRVEFYDKDGFLIEQTSWRPALVKGGGAIHIKERSTLPGAEEFTIVISNDAS